MNNLYIPNKFKTDMRKYKNALSTEKKTNHQSRLNSCDVMDVKLTEAVAIISMPKPPKFDKPFKAI
jgi:hypothetical protein